MKSLVAPTQRQSKYCTAIEHELTLLGHATNAELLEKLREQFPDLSATTVHRATARLARRNAVAIAPNDLQGSIRYDTNTDPHDHFMCSSCGTIKDTSIKDKVIPILESTIDDCKISGQLTITGTCKKCVKEQKR